MHSIPHGPTPLPALGHTRWEGQIGGSSDEDRPWEPIIIPEHAVLILEERLKKQAAEGMKLPAGMPLDELAPRVLIAGQTREIPCLR